MNHRAMTKPVRFPFSHIAPLALTLSVLPLLSACGQPPETPPLAGAQIGGDFALTDRHGRTVQWRDFAGKWRIVYFGYTFCPDACPMDVGILMKGYRQFAKDNAALARAIQPIFITVDPGRDTPARVGEFADAFGAPLIGLTGSQADVDQAARAFAVYHSRGKDLPGGGYLVDHSRAAYLMDPDGKPIAILPTDLGVQQGPPAVATELAKWIK